jgi:hypothetical protein
MFLHIDELQLAQQAMANSDKIDKYVFVKEMVYSIGAYMSGVATKHNVFVVPLLVSTICGVTFLHSTPIHHFHLLHSTLLQTGTNRGGVDFEMTRYQPVKLLLPPLSLESAVTIFERAIPEAAIDDDTLRMIAGLGVVPRALEYFIQGYRLNATPSASQNAVLTVQSKYQGFIVKFASDLWKNGNVINFLRWTLNRRPVPWETVEHFAQGGFLFVSRFVSEQVEIFWPHCFWKLLLNVLPTQAIVPLTPTESQLIACLSKIMQYPPKNLPTEQAVVFGATFELMVATLIAVRSTLYHGSKFFYFLFFFFFCIHLLFFLVVSNR